MDDLSTRTVAQLKALCKEHGVKNYAKLAKAALVEKLTAFLAGTKSGAAGPTVSTATENAAMVSALGSAALYNVASSAAASALGPPNVPANASDHDAALSTALPSTSGSSFPTSDLQASLSLGLHEPIPGSTQLNKRLHESNRGPVAKRRKVEISRQDPATTSKPAFKVPVPPPKPVVPAQTQEVSSIPASLPSAKTSWPSLTGSFKPLSALPPARLPVLEDNRGLLPVASLPSATAPAHGHLHLKPTAPFKPLRPLVPSSDPARNRAPPAPQHLPAADNSRISNDIQLDFSNDKFPPLAELAPRPISMPMKLRQRPVARKWAILLTCLSDSERAHVVFVSKALRYAGSTSLVLLEQVLSAFPELELTVYLSASQMLRVDFPGARLASYLRSVRDPEVMDLWPYLRARQEEATKRRAAYDASFLPQFYSSQGAMSSVAPVLWTSPDNEDQLTVVLRFLASKAWFAVSLPGSPERVRKWLGATVTDAQEVSKGAVWSITQTQPTGECETLYVLYETCEVISSASSSGPRSDIPVRHDWAQHLAALPSANGRDSLLDLIMWHNGEEYERGISKLWLRRVPADDARRRVAERYVLACVAPNSVSGTYKTARQMADEFASLGSSTDARATAARPSLYLPEHHYVESVSFVAAKPFGQPLHPALAAVQTPGREYIILRNTGMHVGCEEDGVADVWMKILRCDSRGVAARS